MKISILGANGLLGNHIIEEFQEFDLIPLSRKECDITNIDHINQIKSDIIINCAAYTNVDAAENNIEEAFNINANALRNLSIRANETNSVLVHISTDFVFDGNKIGYLPTDIVNPLSIYGRSKLVGEILVKDFCNNYRIVRVQSLYGDKGTNFASKLTNFLIQQSQNIKTDTIKLDNKRLVQPTYGKFVANGLKNLINANNGIYHLSSNGQTTWYEFGSKISQILGLKNKIEAVNNFPYLAQRPTNSIFSYKRDQVDWSIQLENYLNKRSLQ